MKKKRFRAALAVALVAVAGVGAYETYQDYKADKESTLVMLNIEALTEDDASAPSQNGLTCNDGMGAIYDISGINVTIYSERTHDYSDNQDFIQNYRITYCVATGHGEKIGSSNDYAYKDEKYGSSYKGKCNMEHYSHEAALANIMLNIIEQRKGGR